MSNKTKQRKRTKPTSEMTPQEAYEYCLELERKRQWKFRRTSQGKFESQQIVSIDALMSHEGISDMDDLAIVSDGGKGAAAIRGYDENPAAKSRQQRDNAARRLRRNGLSYLVPVFLLVCKNGNNREESIWELAKRR